MIAILKSNLKDLIPLPVDKQTSETNWNSRGILGGLHSTDSLIDIYIKERLQATEKFPSFNSVLSENTEVGAPESQRSSLHQLMRLDSVEKHEDSDGLLLEQLYSSINNLKVKNDELENEALLSKKERYSLVDSLAREQFNRDELQEEVDSLNATLKATREYLQSEKAYSSGIQSELITHLTESTRLHLSVELAKVKEQLKTAHYLQKIENQKALMVQEELKQELNTMRKIIAFSQDVDEKLGREYVDMTTFDLPKEETKESSKKSLKRPWKWLCKNAKSIRKALSGKKKF